MALSLNIGFRGSGLEPRLSRVTRQPMPGIPAMLLRPLTLELRLGPNPALVSVVRRYVEQVIERHAADDELVSRAALTAHELMENAARYAPRDAEATLVLALAIETEPGAEGARLTLRLSNPAGPADVDRLRAMCARLDECADPWALYLELMRRQAHESDVHGIGLARIRAEGEMSLSLEVRDGKITVAACTSFPAV
jgi:hypothetical protein